MSTGWTGVSYISRSSWRFPHHGCSHSPGCRISEMNFTIRDLSLAGKCAIRRGMGKDGKNGRWDDGVLMVVMVVMVVVVSANL